jgi:ATP-dependent DNA helicase PIF1
MTVDKSELTELDEDQQLVVESVISGKNVLMHGPAGTGKSVTLKKIIYLLRQRQRTCALTAFTGGASINIGGSTIHSLFQGLGLMKEDIPRLIKKLKRLPVVLARLRSIDVLVIDEISMISMVFFDKIDALLRFVLGRKDIPFGGIQLFLAGDFFQLPPMEKSDDGEIFAFESKVWEELKLTQIELTIVHRQTDPEFVRILHEMRRGKLGLDGMCALCERVNKEIGDGIIVPTSLFATNKEADTENNKELLKLNGEQMVYEARCVVSTKPNIKEHDLKEIYRTSMQVTKHCAAPEILNLRPGAQVMLRINMDLENGLANGSRGYVRSYSEDGFPIVQFINGKIRTIIPYNFLYKYPQGTITVTQVPLLLAWAMTIHKCEGSTLDLVSISTNSIFLPGQAYVAFSRVRTLEGLTLRDFNPRAIKADDKVKKTFPVNIQNNENNSIQNENKKRKIDEIKQQ